MINAICIFSSQNTFHLTEKGLKIIFTPLLHRYPTILWQSSSNRGNLYTISSGKEGFKCHLPLQLHPL